MSPQPTGSNLKSPFFQLFPVFILLFGLLDLVYFKTAQNYTWLIVSISILLLGGHLHVAVTFLILQKLKSLDEWRKSLEKKSHLPFYIIIAGAFLLIALSFYAVYSSQDSLWKNLLLKAFVVYGWYHILRQTLGVSLIFNRLSTSELSTAQRTEKFEKSLNSILILTFVFHFFIEDHLHFRPRYILGAVVLVQLVSIVIHFLQTWWASPTLFRDKFIFNLRYFIYPLALVSPYGIFLALAVHGPEYYSVANTLFRREAQSRNGYRRNLMWAGFWLLLVLVIFLMDGRFVNLFSTQSQDQNINCFFVFTRSFSLCHYIFDSFIFKMKNPLIRQNIGKLLAS